MKILFTLIFIGLLSGAARAQTIFEDVTVIQYGDSVLVSWTLVAGSTCFDMHVMRAEEDTGFESVYTVSGICGGAVDQYYSYLDKKGLISGKTYYYIISASAGTFETEAVEIEYINAGGVQVFIYPNPSMTEINVTIDNSFKPGFLVELFTVDGKLLKQTKQFENLFTITTGYLSAGTYLLKITTEDGYIFGDRLVVQ